MATSAFCISHLRNEVDEEDSSTPGRLEISKRRNDKKAETKRARKPAGLVKPRFWAQQLQGHLRWGGGRGRWAADGQDRDTQPCEDKSTSTPVAGRKTRQQAQRPRRAAQLRSLSTQLRRRSQAHGRPAARTDPRAAKSSMRDPGRAVMLRVTS